MRARYLIVAIAALLVASVAAADRVVLRNGETFDDVIVRAGDDEIEIQLGFGRLEVPRSMVLRVEKASSPLAEYVRREALLTADPAATGEAWLALALWADARGLEHGTREAALTAAEFEPGLEGLPRLMRRFGYTLDREGDLWVKYRPPAPATPPSPRPAIARREPPPRETVAHEGEVERRLARAVELMAEAGVEREPRVEVRVVAPPVTYAPVVAVPGWFVGGGSAGSSVAAPPVPGAPATGGNRFVRELIRFQPGSALPFGRLHPGR